MVSVVTLPHFHLLQAWVGLQEQPMVPVDVVLWAMPPVSTSLEIPVGQPSLAAVCAAQELPATGSATKHNVRQCKAGCTCLVTSECNSTCKKGLSQITCKHQHLKIDAGAILAGWRKAQSAKTSTIPPYTLQSNVLSQSVPDVHRSVSNGPRGLYHWRSACPCGRSGACAAGGRAGGIR